MRWTVPILALCVTACAWYLTLPVPPDSEREPIAAPEAELVLSETASNEASVTELGDEKSDTEVPPSSGTDATKEPWKVVPPQREVVRAQYDPTQPLTRNLVFVQPCSVQVRQGRLRIPFGVLARLVQDHGDSVEVQVGGTTINVPRMMVASVNSVKEVEGPSRPAAVLSSVTSFFERVFQPLPNSLGMDVKEIGTGKGIDRKWQAYWGSYERDFYHTKGLQVDVRNVSRSGSGPCQAEVYWFARRLADRKLVIHHREVIPLEVNPITSVSRRFWSPLAASGVDKYVLLGKTNVAGVKLSGWAVAITRDGKILAGRGSGPEQDQIARSAPQLGALVASYVPTGRSATEEMPAWRTDPIREEWGSRRGTYQDKGKQNPEERKP